MVAISIDTEQSFGNANNGVERLLEILDRHAVLATFFVTEDILFESPRLVEQIASQGHEIGYHGFHIPYFKRNLKNLDASRISAELVRVLNRCEQLSLDVVGFRAEGFRITEEALAIIANHFVYDSSLIGPGPGGTTVYRLTNGMVEVAVAEICLRVQLYPFFSIYLPPAWLASLVAKRLSPLVLYYHCFDFQGNVTLKNRKISRLKQHLYYRRITPRFGKRFSELLVQLKRRGRSFVRLRDCACGQIVAPIEKDHAISIRN